MKMLALLIGIALAGPALAGPPATQPAWLAALPPAAPITRAGLTDPRQPVFVPKFAQADRTPAGHFAERDYARRYTYPGPIYSGYGCFVGGYYGYAPGTWGSTTISFR